MPLPMANSMDIEWANDSEDKQGLLSQDPSNVRQWSVNDRYSRRKHIIHLVILYSVNFVISVCLIWSVFYRKDPSLAVYCMSFFIAQVQLRGPQSLTLSCSTSKLRCLIQNDAIYAWNARRAFPVSRRADSGEQ